MKKKQEIIDLMNSDQPVLLHFYTTTCATHKAIQSLLRELKKKESDIKFDTVNIELRKQPELVEDLEIEGIPTVVLYTGGKEKWRRAGAVSKAQVMQALKRVYADD